MKRVGFIDLQPSEAIGNVSGAEFAATDFPFSVHVFKSTSAGYEFENSIKYSGDKPAPLHVNTKDIEEFYLSLPLESLDFRILKLPFSDREKLKKVIPFELDSLLMERSDSVVFDSIVIGNSDNTFDVLVTYVKKEILKDLLAKLSTLNLEPRIITSIELEAIVKSGMGNLAMRLMNRELINAGDRASIAMEALAEPTIDLRTGLFAYTKDDEKMGRLLRLTSVLFILLVLIIHADLAFRIIAAKGETSSIKREMRNIYAGLFPNEKKISDELYQMKSHVKEIQDKGDALIGVHPLRLLLNLSQKKTPRVVFNEITVDRELFTIKGEAGSMDDIGEIKTRLSEFLTNVSISDIHPSTDGKTFFTVIAMDLE